MTDTDQKKAKDITGATVIDAESKIIRRITKPEAYYHLRNGNMTVVSRKGTRLILKCTNSNIETLLTSEG